MHGSKPWGEAFIAMVKAGPVDKDKAVATLSGLVPPGQAWRTYARTRRSLALRRGLPDPEMEPNEDGIRSGARQIVVSMMVAYQSRGRIRKEEDAWGRVTYHYVRDALPQPSGEEARRRALKGVETLRRKHGDDFFSERTRKAALARTTESRREGGRSGWEGKTPEERAAIIRKGLEAYPAEERAKNVSAGWQRRSKEERQQISLQRWAKIDEEERHRRAMKGAETRRRRAWFREGSQGSNDTVQKGPEGRDEQDQHGGEGRAAPHHEGALG